ncbi:sensor histidine kinase [Rhodococcus rhodnii]|uniref:histidine kinase n=1 Tax=Rhodococcus rhodnii TaxID=38312 RepID=A0A6P2C8R7_9NOCA|nr:sensor histidine kinase [Rhodococcus rhodnii]
MRILPRPHTLAGRLFVWQLVVLVAVVSLGIALTIVDERREADSDAEHTVTEVAATLALSDGTADAVRAPDPSAVLQPETERIRAATGVDFVVVMAPDRTRYTHTDPSLIGGAFTGSIDRALAGETFTETFTGSLGPSVRAVAPVFSGDDVVALVSVGVTRERIGDRVAGALPQIFAVAAAGLVLAAGASLALSRRLRRQTLGLEPDELRRLYEHRDAILHSIGEGLIVIPAGAGPDELLDLVNDEARQLLALPDGTVRIADLPESLVAASGGDELHVAGDRVLVVDRRPVLWEGRTIGTVLTARDRTELRNALGELDSVRSFAETLRSHAHESANRMHTMVTMVELGRYDEAAAFGTADLRLSQGLVDTITAAVHDPAVAALLLGKTGEAAERGVELTVTDDTRLDGTAPLGTHEAITVLGNLVDNAIDSAADQPGEGWVEIAIARTDGGLRITVSDSGPGLDDAALERASARGYTTKATGPAGRGLGLALVRRIVERHHGTMAARREPESSITVVLPDVVLPYGGAS